MLTTLDHVQFLIQQYQRFVLTTHVNPDGDGLGSEIALAHYLRNIGKNATILNHNITPEHYQWLDTQQEIVHFEPKRDGDKILRADVIFILDTNQPERLRSLEPFVRQSKAVKIVIDHHLEPNPFGDQYILDDDATSTGELVYRLIQQSGGQSIDRDIANALYTAIMTDTGSFRFPRTDSEIHQITASLIESGADPTEIYANIYERWSAGRMRLLGEILKAIKLAYNGKLAYVVCTQKMFEETGTTEVETDNFTTYPMSIRGVLIGILINELHNGVKISFRSKGNIPINRLAKEFGGNGHLNAAGARLYNIHVDEVVNAIIEKSGKYLNPL